MTKKENTGDYNTGDGNTGDFNIGDHNTGDFNIGDHNTGARNVGDYNVGYCNTSDWNIGSCNTGHNNTGNYNTGNYNTGYYNTGNWNTGYCNTITPDECFIFNKKGSRKEWEECDKPQWMYNIRLTEWVVDYDMSDKEKEAYPSYTTTGGYLKVKTFKQASLEAWEKADEDDRAKTFNLPNFDIDVFEEIFSFRPTKQKSVMYKGIEITEKDLKGVCSRLGNVLESVTVKEYPVIDTIKQEMISKGAMNSLMSGSGPTVFGIFKTAEEAKKAKEALWGKYKTVYICSPV